MTQTIDEKPNQLIADFWQVAADFYQRTPVKQLLLGLQDEHHYSISRLLFSLWYSQTFQKLIDGKKLSQSIEQLTKVEQSVTELRSTRRTFEQSWKKPYLGNINMARYHMLEGELSLEKEIQSLLVIGLCDKQAVSETAVSMETLVSAETLDFLIGENIERLCADNVNTSGSTSNNFAIQQLSMLWIQQ